MQFIVLTRRRSEVFADADYTAARLEQEAQVVRGLYADGAVRQIWHRADVGGACMLLESGSEDDVRRLLALLPLFAAGMQEAVMIVPLLPYRGFGPR
jgi:muconolactone delta-isomerase